MASEDDVARALQRLRRIEEVRRAAAPGSHERTSADRELEIAARDAFATAVALNTPSAIDESDSAGKTSA